MNPEELTPRKIVAELDKYIVGQDEAKRSVAIAIRNRWRRFQLPPEMRNEIAPKNIILIGPTGVGKTEIARRVAGLVSAPFLKVEASRYTEVGYHGRDVESMVRDMIEVSVGMVKMEEMAKVQGAAEGHAEERLLDLLIPKSSEPSEKEVSTGDDGGGPPESRRGQVRERFREKLRNRQLEDRQIEITVEERTTPFMQVFSGSGLEEIGMDMPGALGNLFPSRSQTKRMSVGDARRIITLQEAEKLIDRDKVTREGLQRAQEFGIIFIDEIDKIVGAEKTHGPDVSREGVQRDLLPIVEGATVMTRYGAVKTDHILFIAAGAFSFSKPTDLIPELQGRFPLRAELKSLKHDDFVRILTEPKHALIKQYKALLETEGIKLEFKKDAIDEMAGFAARINSSMQDIGARRLHTVVEKVLEDISFEAPEKSGSRVVIDARIVRERLKGISEDEDLRKYIL